MLHIANRKYKNTIQQYFRICLVSNNNNNNRRNIKNNHKDYVKPWLVGEDQFQSQLEILTLLRGNLHIVMGLKKKAASILKRDKKPLNQNVNAWVRYRFYENHRKLIHIFTKLFILYSWCTFRPTRSCSQIHILLKFICNYSIL